MDVLGAVAGIRPQIAGIADAKPWEPKVITAVKQVWENVGLKLRVIEGPPSLGEKTKFCAACHRMDRKGSGHEFPSLLDIGNRRTETDIDKLIRTGSGRMPSFSWLADPDRNALTGFLLGKETPTVASEHSENSRPGPQPNGTFPYQPKYIAKVWKKFTDSGGVPITGTDNYGGPIVTAGELVFIAATRDERIRAFSLPG